MTTQERPQTYRPQPKRERQWLRGPVTTTEPTPKQRSTHPRLRPPQVEELRRRRQAGETISSLAKAYGLTKEGVRNIVHRRSWPELDRALRQEV